MREITEPAASSAQTLGKARTAVDGVISIDPVALSYLLDATGPVTLPSGDVLTSKNAVGLLLNEVYTRYQNSREQDVFFATAAGSVFTALTSGTGSTTELLEALARAGSEHRLLVWSRDQSEQGVLAGTTLQGALPATDQTTTAFASTRTTRPDQRWTSTRAWTPRSRGADLMRRNSPSSCVAMPRRTPRTCPHTSPVAGSTAFRPARLRR